MRWLTRPSVVLFCSFLILLFTGYILLHTEPSDITKPTPFPVTGEDQEIVWLYAATNPATWERFVCAINHAAETLQLQVDESRAFPRDTSATPELYLSSPTRSGRLLFRWYKLTGSWKANEWVQALLRRERPPLAIIGGSSSDGAFDLAGALERQAQALGERAPLLLLTTATSVGLRSRYPGRSFRYCFHNQCLADAIMSFLHSQEDLKPTANEVSLASWDDDPYSMDLRECYTNSLSLSLDPTQKLFTHQRVYSSVGQFDRPNRGETEAADFLLQEFRIRSDPANRPLLVLPAQIQPSRRFLRALMRQSPSEAQRFIVASGDAISFNAIYRDGAIAWPIQELPFSLVLFCHRNPVAETLGFRPLGPERLSDSREIRSQTSATDDLLLFLDIADSLLTAAFGSEALESPEQLKQHLQGVTFAEGRLAIGVEGTPLFDEQGDRRKGTGEHVVWLKPIIQEGRIAPEATISIWYGQNGAGGKRTWQPRREALSVLYKGPPELRPMIP